MTASMNPQPTFTSEKAFRIVGVERYTGTGRAAIHEAWQELGRRAGEIRHQRSPKVRYGFEDYSRDFKITPGEFPKFYYLAGVEVDELRDIPAGMMGKEVPEANYAVFTHHGPMEGVAQLFRYVYDVWLPASGYVIDPRVQADFERYTQRVTDPASMSSAIYIPIVKK
jgi:AraC family transcriptional regulator